MEGKVKQIIRPSIAIEDNILVTQGLSRMYTPDVGLKPLSIELRKGEVLAIAGRSGSGKSTFAKLLLQIERWDGRQCAIAWRTTA